MLLDVDDLKYSIEGNISEVRMGFERYEAFKNMSRHI